jgi:protein-tyrosine phosphatase
MRPALESDLKTIHAAGIRAIVNLCAECYDLEVAAKAAGFEIYFLPVVDEAAPGMEALESLLDWMRQQVDSGNPILVHCRYGMGAQEQSCWPSCCILDTVSRKPAR